MRIIISGGGTGGHIYPAFAIIDALKANDSNADILYVGGVNSLEQDLTKRENIQFFGISVAPLPRKLSLDIARSGVKNLKGLNQSIQIIREFRPDVVIGTGGYVCGVVILAGKLMNIPSLLHEQNAVMGFTNKILSKFVNKVCLTFNEASTYVKNKKKITMTGLPIRSKVMNSDKKTAYDFFDFDANKKTLLITGGSQGAKKINEAIYPLWQDLINQDIQIIHLVGKNNYQSALAELEKQNLSENPNLRVCDFLYEMDFALNIADLVVSRAGASFMAELMVCGKPAILIPYPFATGNHQYANAMSLVTAGGARLIEDAKLDAPTLARDLNEILTNETLQTNMAQACQKEGRPLAAENIVKEIFKLTNK